MPDQMKNLLIGIFITAALAVVVFMLLFIHPYIGDEGQRLHVRFTDIDKVSVGTRVLFAGKPVGEVIEIREVPEVMDSRTQHKGDIYAYELVLAIDSSVRVYNSDDISLRTSGLLGEKSVAIDPEPLQPGQKIHLMTKDDIIYAEGVGSVEDTFKELKQVGDKFETALEAVTDALNELKEKKLWQNIGDIAENMNEITGKLADKWDDVDGIVNNLASASVDVRETTDKINRGEGTIGRLISTDDLYLKTSSLISKGETVLDDVNHYGVLFHLDKGWQRLRARRLNLLQELQTPQEFRNFFTEEVSQIQTSLARVTMVLEKSYDSPNYECMVENREFTKVFAELMRRVGDLEEMIQMYNIQLNECGVQQTELVP